MTPSQRLSRDVSWRDRTIPWEERDEQERKDLRDMWSIGCLDYKLDSSQLPVYHDIRASHGKVEASADRVYVLDIGRRWGKDYLMAVMAAEEMIRHPRGRIPYGAMSKESVRDLLWPILLHVFSDCPPEMRPKANESTKEWRHSNGTVLKAVGCNQEPDSLRGPGMVAAFLTECAFYRRLTYVLESVLGPMALTCPDAFFVYGSSPPESPVHEWSSEVVVDAKLSGFYAHRTIEDNPRISEVQKEAAIRKIGGRTSTRCRREYYAEHIVEETLAIIPEWSDANVVELERPAHFDAYVDMDVGFSDFTVAALGYFDFRRAAVYIEGEVCRARSTSSVIDRAVAEKEFELWGGQAPYMRYVDAPPQGVAELTPSRDDPKAWWNAEQDVPDELRAYVLEHGRHWSKTRNDELQAAVNALRVAVGALKVLVHPRCKVIISHLRHGVWKATAAGSPREFGRSGKFGHFDGTAATMYLERDVDRARNPFPALEGVAAEDHWVPDEKARAQSVENQALSDAFRPRRAARGRQPQ